MTSTGLLRLVARRRADPGSPAALETTRARAYAEDPADISVPAPSNADVELSVTGRLFRM